MICDKIAFFVNNLRDLFGVGLEDLGIDFD
jgi:hypothetical protein